jgi:phage repressor protein C with HTH and peptisase S24 domain
MVRQPKAQRMLTHEQVWTALDRLAERAGLSASGLARKSGLDPTTFNKSKRVTPDGRERWPSTESISKALAATASSIDSFVQLIGDGDQSVQSVPLLGLAQAGIAGAFDDSGFPAGKGWDEIGLPGVSDERAYALEISGDAMKPAYRDGDVIVVSPGTPIRRGDRVAVKTRSGEVLLRELKRRTARSLELQSLNQSQPDRTLAAAEVQWIARIVWVSQ